MVNLMKTVLFGLLLEGAFLIISINYQDPTYRQMIIVTFKT